jgi:hypothetical protein
VNYNNVRDILLLLKMSRRTLIILLDKGSVRKLICMAGGNFQNLDFFWCTIHNHFVLLLLFGLCSYLSFICLGLCSG